MKGPLHVIRRRRVERSAAEVDAEQAVAEPPTQAQPVADPGPATASDAMTQAGEAAGQPATAAVPAGQEPVPTHPSFRHRGRLRRRVRYLRRVRELGFRDLGGLVFDQHRFASVNEELVRGKLAALAAVDAELRALEVALDDRRPITELREPGVSVCARCGALHGSEARFCPSCGVPVRGPLAMAEVGEAVSLPGAEPGLASARVEAEPAPAATELAEREAAKAQAEAQGSVTAQPTEIMRPVGAEQPADGAQPGAGGDPGRVAQPTGERSEP